MATEQPPVKRTPTKAAIAANAPWLPPQWEIADAAAIQALRRGDATQDQQRRALDYIVQNLCGAYDMDWRPGGVEGARDSDFAAGRRFVGLQIVKLNNLALSKFKSEPSEQT